MWCILWKKLCKVSQKTHITARWFSYRKIDPATGLLARPDQKDSIYEIFTQETVPTEVAHWYSDSIDNASGVEGIFNYNQSINCKSGK